MKRYLPAIRTLLRLYQPVVDAHYEVSKFDFVGRNQTDVVTVMHEYEAILCRVAKRFGISAVALEDALDEYQYDNAVRYLSALKAAKERRHGQA